jgi:hypothetical protein
MTDLTTCSTSPFTGIQFSVKVGPASRLVLLSCQSPFLVLLDFIDGLHETAWSAQQNVLFKAVRHSRNALQFVFFRVTTWFEHLWVLHEIHDLPFFHSFEVSLNDGRVSDNLELLFSLDLTQSALCRTLLGMDLQYA